MTVTAKAPHPVRSSLVTLNRRVAPPSAGTCFVTVDVARYASGMTTNMRHLSGVELHDSLMTYVEAECLHAAATLYEAHLKKYRANTCGFDVTIEPVVGENSGELADKVEVSVSLFIAFTRNGGDWEPREKKQGSQPSHRNHKDRR